MYKGLCIDSYMTWVKLKHQYQLYEQQSSCTELICKVHQISCCSATSDWQCVIEISCESSVSIDVEHNTVSLYVATMCLVLWCIFFDYFFRKEFI